ncbi:MAG: LLM class flavin-dependent oxidoreductase [Candidatus Dormibacteraeota bacterium]|nr:LLM class flavin-dependent oxidoreductase [Candidatus Dormibacteraeota bacterium]
MGSRLGVSYDAGSSLGSSIERATLAEHLGYDSLWASQLPPARETPLVLATYAAATSKIGLGTAVMPIYTRHPTAMAQMALTLDEIAGGRFRLGIGVSHQVTVESMWGLRLVHPVEAMREYAGIVRSLITTGSASAVGEHFSAHTSYTGPRREDLPILISALSPRMLELAGEIADGVSLWMCAPDYIRDVVIPTVRKGREKAGKSMDGFEIEAAVPVCLTSDREAGLAVFRKTAERYGSLPFYRKVLDKTFPDMSDSPNDTILGTLAGIGDVGEVRATVDRYRDAGATLPVVGPFAGHEGAAGFQGTLEALAA